MTKAQRLQIKETAEKADKLGRQIDHASPVFHTVEQVKAWQAEYSQMMKQLDALQRAAG